MEQKRYPLLENIHSPEDVQKLSVPQLEELATQVRRKLISVVSKTGGHLASNLGVVELTLAIHKVFHSTEHLMGAKHQFFGVILCKGIFLCGLFQQDEILDIALWPFDRRKIQLLCGKSQRICHAVDLEDRIHMDPCLAHHTVFPHMFAPCFKLGLDEGLSVDFIIAIGGDGTPNGGRR